MYSSGRVAARDPSPPFAPPAPATALSTRSARLHQAPLPAQLQLESGGWCGGTLFPRLLCSFSRPRSSFPSGDDRASCAARCSSSDGRFAGDEHPTGVCLPSPLPSHPDLTVILATNFDLFATVIGCTCITGSAPDYRDERGSATTPTTTSSPI